MDHTLHLIGTHYLFFGFHSKFSANGDVLAWQEPVDSIFISEEVSAVTSTTGDVWAVYRNEVPGGIEALFVRMNEDGSQTVRRPFGAAPEFFSYANSLTTAPNGDICCCASVSGGHIKRYCRLDSTLAVVEWRDLVVNDLVLRNAIASNNAGQVFVTWGEEPSPSVYSVYASTYDQTEGWISDGAPIGSQLRPLTYFDACPISDENEWAVVGCILDSDGSPFYPDLYLFTTDTATSVSSNNARLANSQMFTTYPNPFNSTLSISLEIPLHQEVTVSLYDLLGREVDVIQRGRLESSTLSYSAPPSLASGIYFVRAVTAREAVMRKVVLLK
ncbi:MAG: T9SS type A sorting domain-containing protein [bacterium]|nr:T9SS type A sorting domain-containing protein [bacterium]